MKLVSKALILTASSLVLAGVHLQQKMRITTMITAHLTPTVQLRTDKSVTATPAISLCIWRETSSW